MEIVFPGGKRVDAIYKGFTIKTDQSKNNGGDGSAPTPFSYFLTSIGTCAGFYALAFCQERGISTEGLKLILRTDRERQTNMIKKITIEIQLPSEFPEKYNKAIIKSAELCSVAKHLYNPPTFDIYTKMR